MKTAECWLRVGIWTRRSQLLQLIARKLWLFHLERCDVELGLRFGMSCAMTVVWGAIFMDWVKLVVAVGGATLLLAAGVNITRWTSCFWLSPALDANSTDSSCDHFAPKILSCFSPFSSLVFLSLFFFGVPLSSWFLWSSPSLLGFVKVASINTDSCCLLLVLWQKLTGSWKQAWVRSSRVHWMHCSIELPVINLETFS